MAAGAAGGRANRRPGCVCSSGVRAWRCVPVRLERGLGDDRRRARQAASRPRQAVPQPRLRDARLPAANPGDAVRRSQPRLRAVGWRATARHLRQHEHCSRSDRPRQAARGQQPVCGDGEPLFVRDRVLQSRCRLEKGQVEKNVQDARRRIWHGAPGFCSLADLNLWLDARCLALWQETAHPEQAEQNIFQVWQTEREQLMKLPPPFDGYIEHIKRVSPTCLIHFERNRYSVPASFANRPVSLRVYARRLLIAAEGQIIAQHERVIVRSHCTGRTIYDWRHYLSVLQRKPGALRNGAPFLELPEAFKRLQRVLLKHHGGDREMVEILALVLHHDEQAVLTAVELALESGAPSKQHVLNLLSRLIAQTPPAPVVAPQALVLAVEPQANVSRYDGLREGNHAA